MIATFYSPALLHSKVTQQFQLFLIFGLGSDKGNDILNGIIPRTLKGDQNVLCLTILSHIYTQRTADIPKHTINLYSNKIKLLAYDRNGQYSTYITTYVTHGKYYCMVTKRLG